MLKHYNIWRSGQFAIAPPLQILRGIVPRPFPVIYAHAFATDCHAVSLVPAVLAEVVLPCYCYFGAVVHGQELSTCYVMLCCVVAGSNTRLQFRFIREHDTSDTVE